MRAIWPAAALLAGASASMAEDRVELELSGFRSSSGMDLRVDSITLGQGTQIDLDEDLGFGDAFEIGRGDLRVRVTERNRFALSWFGFEERRDERIDETIEFRDVVYDIDTVVRAGLKVDVARAAWMWSPLRNERHELSLLGGLHWLDIEIFLTSDDGQLAERAQADTVLPVFGLEYRLRFDERWSLDLRGEYFQAEIGDWDGDVFEYGAGVAFHATDHLALRLGYLAFEVDATVSRSRYSGDIRAHYRGPQFGAIVSF